MTLPVREPPVFENLEQRIEDFGMRLLHLVEQNDLVGPAPDGFGQLTTAVVTHVARRRAEQPGDVVTFHVLRHVEAQQRVLVVEEVGREALGQLRLADARWAEEEEGPNGPAGVR